MQKLITLTVKKIGKYMKASSLFLLLIFIVALSYFFGYSGAVILKNSQPNSVSYDAKYELKIEEGSRKIRLFNFSRILNIQISRQGNDFSYGHRIDIDILGNDISKTKVEWLKSGINLKFDSGHILFIPKKSFEGGR